jgi:hypothetical protein
VATFSLYNSNRAIRLAIGIIGENAFRGASPHHLHVIAARGGWCIVFLFAFIRNAAECDALMSVHKSHSYSLAHSIKYTLIVGSYCKSFLRKVYTCM